MATTPATIPTVVRGVSLLLTGYIVADFSIKDTDISEATPDQMGATVDEQSYDVRSDLRLTLWGPDTAPCAAGDEDLTFATKTWKVESCEKIGSYEGKQKWAVAAHRFTNYPAGA